MRGAISKSGGNASLAGERGEGEPSTGTKLETTDTAKGMHLSLRSVPVTTGGQGVHREVESEGSAEKHRAVIEGATPLMNRSAKGGARSSLHYGGEGVLIHPLYQGVCGRHGAEDLDVTSTGTPFGSG